MHPFSFFNKGNLPAHATFGLFVSLSPTVPRLEAYFKRIAAKTFVCLLSLALLPVILRVVLLLSHPPPMTQAYEAFGRVLPELPWAGVLLSAAAFCSLSYWMLRGWMSPAWALIGGILAVFEFGPLNEWTNCYWGVALSGVAGCLTFGALPRLRQDGRGWYAVCLGLGIALQILVGPFEAILLLLSVFLFLVPFAWKEKNWRALLKPGCVATLVLLPALGLSLLHSRQATGNWVIFPKQPVFVPQLQNQAQNAPFFGFSPLYLALAAFAFTLLHYRFIWVMLSAVLFTLGSVISSHSLTPSSALASGLFLLMAVAGLQQIARFRSRRGAAGFKVAAAILLACTFRFAFRWDERWRTAPHQEFSRRALVNECLDRRMKKNGTGSADLHPLCDQASIAGGVDVQLGG
jgi:hypothetical protein